MIVQFELAQYECSRSARTTLLKPPCHRARMADSACLRPCFEAIAQARPVCYRAGAPSLSSRSRLLPTSDCCYWVLIGIPSPAPDRGPHYRQTPVKISLGGTRQMKACLVLSGRPLTLDRTTQ
eukprot:6198268-Pleurochrysis_carterae.AAC.4